MNAAVDLHIHSALSPCGDEEMTPNNIVNMALLKELDIIAITDHNTAENFQAVSKCAAGRDILVVAGLEVESREEVHLLTLFPGIREALAMQEAVQAALPELENREEVFGAQLVMDENDNVIRMERRLLITASALSVEDVFNLARDLNGVMVPAHIDRGSYSIISNLGLIPEGLNLKYLEISRGCDARGFLNKNSFLRRYELLRSSDAHRLGDILERESFIRLEEVSAQCLIHTLKY